MNIKELVERLQVFDPEMEVWIHDAIEGNDYELSDVDESEIPCDETLNEPANKVVMLY